MARHIEKNLANCTPLEFLKQTNKIRKSVEKWLTDTDVLNIRKRLPKTDGLDGDAKESVIREQWKRNLSAILDAVLEKHPEETLELLGLLCFVEPEHVNEIPMSEYLGALGQVISDKEVSNFFISLVQLGRMNISD